MKRAAVIGAGPAGFSAGAGLIRLGYDVTLYEQRPQRSGRVCGTFLNPEAVAHLKWLKVHDDVKNAGAVEVRETRVTHPNGNETLISTEGNGHTSLAIPRPDLETCLSKKLSGDGAVIHFGTRVIDLKQTGEVWGVLSRDEKGLLSSKTFDLIILADGRFSLANEAPHLSKLALRSKQTGWFGWNAKFLNVEQKPGEQSLHIFPGGYVGIVTYQDGTSNICGLIKKAPLSPRVGDDAFAESLKQSPPMKALLKNSKRIGEWLGVGPLPYSLRMRKNKNFILAGDAAAVGDPFMGEGIGRALGAGPMIVAARQRSSENLIDSYQQLWRDHYRTRLFIGVGARWILSGGLPFKWGADLFQKKPLVSFLTPYFHTGFAS